MSLQRNRRSPMAHRIGMLFFAVVFGSVSTVAAPTMKTLAQLAREEGWDPDAGDRPNLDKDIPRDFPVPAGSHHLVASNTVPFASVTGGTTPAETEEFYRSVFAMQGWHIIKEVKFSGFINFIACKSGQCAGVSSSSAEVDPSHPNLIKLHFFKDKS